MGDGNNELICGQGMKVPSPRRQNENPTGVLFHALLLEDEFHLKRISVASTGLVACVEPSLTSAIASSSLCFTREAAANILPYDLLTQTWQSDSDEMRGSTRIGL